MGVDSMPESSRDSAAIGGIVAIYYGGTLIGGLVGGWLGDEIGRIRTTLVACVVAIIGAAFQSSAQHITWMMFARIVTGLGTVSCMPAVLTLGCTQRVDSRLLVRGLYA